jgi:hypothetical protein
VCAAVDFIRARDPVNYGGVFAAGRGKIATLAKQMMPLVTPKTT